MQLPLLNGFCLLQVRIQVPCAKASLAATNQPMHLTGLVPTEARIKRDNCLRQQWAIYMLVHHCHSHGRDDMRLCL
jgi:hypothetical protein